MRGLSVCPINQSQQWRAAGLLLVAPPAGDIDRSQALALSSNGAAALRRSVEGSVSFTATEQ